MADDMDRITIETGMQDISSGTCIKFIPRTHEGNFLDIQPRYGWVWLPCMAFTHLRFDFIIFFKIIIYLFAVIL